MVGVVVLVFAALAGVAYLGRLDDEERECERAHEEFLEYVGEHVGLEPGRSDPIWRQLRACARDDLLETEDLNDPDLWVPDS